MALGGGGKKMKIWHWALGFATIAVAAWVGVSFLPGVWNKISGMFSKTSA